MLRFYVVNLLRETNVLCLLPGALLLCCSSSNKDLWEGIRYDAEKFELSQVDKRAIITGRNRLTRLTRMRAYARLFKEQWSRRCSDPLHCRIAWKILLVELMRTGWLNPFDDPCAILVPGLCEECSHLIYVEWRRVATELWDGLPQVFDLANWDALKDATYSADADTDGDTEDETKEATGDGNEDTDESYLTDIDSDIEHE